MNESQEKYKKFCEKIEYIPIFLEWWWIDAVTEGNWHAVFSYTKDGKEIRGAMPFYKTKIYKLFKIIQMPKQTQVIGCWLNYPKNQKLTSKYSFEKDVMTDLIEKLPNVDYFMQRFHYTLNNWLPFYWKGFKQTTQVTYVLDDLNNLEKVYNNFRSNIKTDIKKAQKTLTVVSEENIEKFYEINILTFRRQNTKPKYSLEFLKKLHKEIQKREQGKIYFAKDKDNNIHAAIYIVWDKKSAYYMWGGGNPDFRNSGAHSLLMWQAIQDCSQSVNRFDFEGSMIEPVERFFRAFGAKQIQYNKIYKFNNKLLELLYLLKEWKNGKS